MSLRCVFGARTSGTNHSALSPRRNPENGLASAARFVCAVCALCECVWGYVFPFIVCDLQSIIRL